MGISTPVLADDVSHWRVPGDDDQGQEARRALYAHSLAGSDDDESDGFEKISNVTDTNTRRETTAEPVIATVATNATPLKWDDDIDARDRLREARHDQAFFAAHHQHVVHVQDQQLGAAATAAPTGTQAGVLIPLEVDRRFVREVMKEKLGSEVVRIRFISSGTFHKAYLITLSSPTQSTYTQVVLRVARRFLPKLKTESEVATLRYLRAHTSVPVPEVYWYDANPYNRLGGEYIVMEKAKGVPLRKVYHSLPHKTLTRFLADLARLVIEVFGHRFSRVGSLYCGEDKSSQNGASQTKQKLNGIGSRSAVSPQFPPTPIVLPSLIPTPPNAGTKTKMANHLLAMIQPLAPPSPTTPPLPVNAPNGLNELIRPALATALSAPTLPSTLLSLRSPQRKLSAQESSSSGPQTLDASDSDFKYHIGPIVSWPFFGSSRGSLSHTQPQEIDRGPWQSAEDYYSACVDRELRGVERENEGRVRVGRLRMDPDEVVVRKKRTRGKIVGANNKGRVFDVRRPVASTVRTGSRLRNEWGFGNVPNAKERGTPDGDGSFSPARYPPLAFALSSSSNGASSSSATSENDDDSDTDSVDSDTSSSSSASVASDEDAFYRDYRCHQRSTFLVAELQRRKDTVLGEMQRWKGVMEDLEGVLNETVSKLVGSEQASHNANDDLSGDGEFALDCHDLSLDNVFVDEKDPGRITCIIDWESTTTRPLWQCAHLPSLLLTSPFASKLFRRAVASLASSGSLSGSASSAAISTLVQSSFNAVTLSSVPECDETQQTRRTASLASQWLLFERLGAPLRYAHKAAEWDGWEEGLVSTVLGEDEQEDESVKTQFRGLGVGTGGIVRLMDPATGANSSNNKPERKIEEPLVLEMKRVCANLLQAGTGQSRPGHKEVRRKHGGHLDHVLSLSIGSNTGSHGSSTARVRTHTLDSAQQTSSAELTPGGRSSSIGRGLTNLALSNAAIGGAPGLSAAVATGARRKSHGACVDDVTDGAEREREKMLDMRGDVCGGRGGELGRRLEAWLVERTGDEVDGSVEDAGDDVGMPLESPTVVGVATHC
ncbi:hypothetical protein SCHPADRAFT_905694 [Schizopora paradoxa]|uniref:Aminoglycoside phosphotransferase domain-containing protein n=1 Tax=Schizopora paradoxa TaxID=27342 RepID=A0A0H2RQS0_9AGAM|nr:hypothetical protein SCHPADRAFT_905694 [Schizopora paradoxa]